MNIFDVINEIAVLGTAVLMMAVSTVWYSSILLSPSWINVLQIPEESSSKSKITMLVGTLVSYVILLTGIAYLVALAPLLLLTPFLLSLFLTLCVGAIIIIPVIWEGKSITYFLINFGFASVFIIGGTFVLQYWPW